MALITNPTANQFRRQGTVFISDTFSSNVYRPEHGNLVAKAAADQGFQGPIVGQAAAEPVRHDETLFAGQVGKDEFQKSFEQDIVDVRMKTLRNSTKVLSDLESKGANHSALNLSLGGSKASAVSDYYERMRLGFSPLVAKTNSEQHEVDYRNARGKNLLHNFATAYGIDEAKLSSKDSAVASAERQKLQQLLVEKVNTAVDGSGELKTAQKSYDSAVHTFESHNNSVVVSAENDGTMFVNMAKDRGVKTMKDLALNMSADFHNNPLANAETTVVGAVNDEASAKARYSSPSKLTEIYTRGSIATNNFGEIDEGTSFSSPRVAAAMAKMHQLNPNLSSEDVEKMVMTMTRQVKDMKVLDTDKLAGVYKK